MWRKVLAESPKENIEIDLTSKIGNHDMVEWIEILTCPSPAVWYCVSTLVVEWIEISIN